MAGRLHREETGLDTEPSGLFLEPGILCKEDDRSGDPLTKATNALQKGSVKRNRDKVKVMIPLKTFKRQKPRPP